MTKGDPRRFYDLFAFAAEEPAHHHGSGPSSLE
jgi:hypothetical protein